MTRVTVLGAGSWGTTFAKVLADSGHPVTLYARRGDVRDEINRDHVNSAYLPQITLPANITATIDIAEACAGAEVLALAVPAQTLRANLQQFRSHLDDQVVLVSLIKGLELESLDRMSQVIAEVTGAGPQRIAVVSGPNLAREIAERQPTATVVAAEHEPTADRIASLLWAPYMRPYTNTDLVGVELGGVLKNVIALAVGVAEGMGLGDNTKATIITRGLAETTRLTLALGGRSSTMAGLAGVGDLVATCASSLSRNRTFGAALGRGLSPAEAVTFARYTAEGAKSARPVLELADRHGVDMPIAEQVVALLEGRIGLHDIGERLLYRPLKAEGN